MQGDGVALYPAEVLGGEAPGGVALANLGFVDAAGDRRAASADFFR